ncbi:MAG: outer membrane protein [Planctomycetota bacterium]
MHRFFAWSLLTAVLSFTLASVSDQAQSDFESDAFNNKRPIFYVAARGGALFPQDSESQALADIGVGNSIEFDPGYNFNGALGLELGYYAPFNLPMRAEIEAGYFATEISDASIDGGSILSDVTGDVDAFNIMGNLLLDIEVTERVDYYIGGGVGASFLSGDISGRISGINGTVTLREDEDTVLAYQLLTGFGFKLHDRLLLDVGYRLWSSQDPEFATGEYDSPLIHTAEIGLRLRF